MNNKQWLVGVMVIGAFFVFSHMGENISVEGRNLPSTNFYGTLKDTSDNVFEIEYITIDHLFKHIPVYEIPKHEQIDPAINTTLLDLAEVHSIKMNDPEKIVTFNNRSYSIITVTMNGSQNISHDYLIGKTKELYCSQKNGSDDIERKLSFQAVVTLEIKGYKKIDDYDNKNKMINNKQ